MVEVDRPDYSHIPSDIFVIRLLDTLLLYAPLHELAALMNYAAIQQLRDDLTTHTSRTNGPMRDIVRALQTRPPITPAPKRGDLAPAFLGILPTRACNLACRYCNFVPETPSHAMPWNIARDAVDWYLNCVHTARPEPAEIHFFGGEPFCADQVMDLTVAWAEFRAREMDRRIRFEVATNGTLDEDHCRWAGDHFDTIVLSFDGPPDIQNQYRGYSDGRGSFDQVARSARLLSEGSAQLFFRCCITDETVDRMVELARWFCENFRPHGVSFEPVQPFALARSGNLAEPDPWTFARHFVQAAPLLGEYGVEPIYAAADIRTRRVSFCPAGQDVAIVTPDGKLNACYLLERDWQAKGMNLCLGQLGDGRAQLDETAIQSVRKLNVTNKPACSKCFCQWHCAGGCHVNHNRSGLPGQYDSLCIQTRIITLYNILASLGRVDLAQRWAESLDAVQSTVLQASDCWMDVE